MTNRAPAPMKNIRASRFASRRSPSLSMRAAPLKPARRRRRRRPAHSRRARRRRGFRAACARNDCGRQDAHAAQRRRDQQVGLHVVGVGHHRRHAAGHQAALQQVGVGRHHALGDHEQVAAGQRFSFHRGAGRRPGPFAQQFFHRDSSAVSVAPSYYRRRLDASDHVCVRAARRWRRRDQPQSARMAALSAPGFDAAPRTCGVLRLKRGAGAGWVTPSTSMKVPRAGVVRMRRRLGHVEHRREADVGAFQQRAPVVAAARLEQRGEALLHLRPAGVRPSGRANAGSVAPVSLSSKA